MLTTRLRRSTRNPSYRLISSLPSTFLGLSIFAVHVLLFWLCYQIFASAPRVNLVQEVRIAAPESGQAITLGWMELGQRASVQSADASHLRLQFGDKKWHFSNVSLDRQIDVETDRYPQLFLKRARLRAGSKVFVGDSWLRFEQVGPGYLQWSDNTGRQGKWDSGQLQVGIGETGPDPCLGETGLLRRMKHRVSHYLWPLSETKEKLVLHLGGGVSCQTSGAGLASRWALPAAEFDSARISRRGNNFYLAPGKGRGQGRSTVAIQEPERLNSSAHGLSDISLPLAGPEYGQLRRLVIGRTYYQIKQDGDARKLILKPYHKQDVWQTRPARVFEQSETTWRTQSYLGAGFEPGTWFAQVQRIAGIELSHIVLTLLLALGISMVVMIPVVLCNVSKYSLSVTLLILFPAATGLAIIVVERLTGPVLDLYWQSILILSCWCWASVVLQFSGVLRSARVAIFWLSSAAIAGLGFMILAQLVIGADTTRWLHAFGNHSLVIAVVPLAVSICITLHWERLLEKTYWLCSSESGGNGILIRFLIGVVLLLLLVLGAATLIVGRESATIAGMQPTEIFKLVLILAFTRFVVVVRENLPNPSAYYEIWRYGRATLSFALVVLVFGSLIFLWIGDLSPVLIVLLFLILGLVELGRPRAASGNMTLMSLRWISLALVCAIASALFWLGTNPQRLLSFSLAPLLPNIERFLVWSNPEAFPELGYQLLLSFRRIAETGVYGAASWFGANETAAAVPAVQDDFILTFVLHKFGGYAGLSLLLLQCCFVVSGLSLSRVLTQMASIQIVTVRIPVLGVGAFVFAATSLVALHWMISWCNVLGILPVMGQPATWISIAPSHLAFVGLPALLAALVAGCVFRDLENTR